MIIFFGCNCFKLFDFLLIGMLMFVLYLLLLCGINKNILIYSICRRYDEMVEKVSDVFDIIEEIVGF